MVPAIAPGHNVGHNYVGNNYIGRERDLPERQRAVVRAVGKLAGPLGARASVGVTVGGAVTDTGGAEGFVVFGGRLAALAVAAAAVARRTSGVCVP